MKLRDFWSKFYPDNHYEIKIASNNGSAYLWLRKGGDWMYLADHNGDFRAAKDDEDLYKIIVDWLNSIKARQDKAKDFVHHIITENIVYDTESKHWATRGK